MFRHGSQHTHQKYRGFGGAERSLTDCETLREFENRVSPCSAGAAAVASILSTVDQYRRGYAMGKQIVNAVNDCTQPVTQVLGLSTACGVGGVGVLTLGFWCGVDLWF